jgi:hypothetical protein
MGKNSSSFLGLQGAPTFMPKPDSSGSSRFFPIGTIIANGGAAGPQEKACSFSNINRKKLSFNYAAISD